MTFTVAVTVDDHLFIFMYLFTIYTMKILLTWKRMLKEDKEMEKSTPSLF